MAVESAVNNLMWKELSGTCCHQAHSSCTLVTVVNPCRRDPTLASRGVRIAVTDLTPFLPIQPMGDWQLRSCAHFPPQPRHYGTLLATDGNHKSRKINRQHNNAGIDLCVRIEASYA
ncbi:hypothetical protein PIB30_061426 [Stylosanthes scabra]|uniref:Uncharacterized protein n=1 Tax=Stylosanthes scabra TaxID=79078 RepID=A0ABU6ZJK5_9FABA|nr:hypothetical protein [Stylosanthes scabra]